MNKFVKKRIEELQSEIQQHQAQLNQLNVQRDQVAATIIGKRGGIMELQFVLGLIEKAAFNHVKPIPKKAK